MASILFGTFVAIGFQNAFTRTMPGKIELIGVSLKIWQCSFLCGYTAVAFAAIPILIKVLPRYKGLWISFGLLVAVSRLYLGAHYLSDIIFGAMVGYLVGLAFLNYKFIIEETELKRQLFHALLGISLVVLLIKGFLGEIGSYIPLEPLPPVSRTFLMILVIGGTTVWTSRKIDIPVIHWFLDKFERKELRYEFPGKGCFLFFLGAFAISLFFQEHIIGAALLILAVGDSTSHVVGTHFGTVKHPLSKDKNIEGHIVGAILSGVVASLLVQPVTAFAAASVVMFVEGIYFKGYLEILNEDNVIIPVLSATMIFMMERSGLPP
ncbi:MAG: phosphatase PAP2 family protein [Thermoplasmata archaeon]